MPDMAAPTTTRRRAARRLTLRTRLTLTYAGLITGSGALLMLLVYLYMRFVPNYTIVGDSDAGFADPGPVVDSGPTGGIAVTRADSFLDNLIVASSLALLAMALFGALVGWLVARRIVRPLSDIGDAARRASEGSLDHRIGLSGPSDEIQDLADTFDQMLASLEGSFAAQRRFTANASHELRSPLATIKTMIDVTLADGSNDVADLRGLLGRISDVNQSNIETVDAMLDLATAEHATVLPEPVEIAELARSVVCDLRDLAASCDVEVEGPSGRAVVFGSPVLIRQAVSNLLRNAIHHNHAGGQVLVTVVATSAAVRLSIVNSGPIMAPADVDSLVEPFTRGSGRTLTRGSGHGLGLAIAAAAVVSSGGRLELAPNTGGGLAAVVELPSFEAYDR